MGWWIKRKRPAPAPLAWETSPSVQPNVKDVLRWLIDRVNEQEREITRLRGRIRMGN